MNPEEKPGHMADIDRRVQETTKILSHIVDAAERIVGRLHGPSIAFADDSPPAAFPAVEGSVRRIHQSIDILNIATWRSRRSVAILTDL